VFLCLLVILVIVEVSVFAAPTVILLQIICARRAGVQSGHGLKMGILSGARLGYPARTHMIEPRWASYLGPAWVTQLGPTWVNPGGHLIWGPLGSPS
ncbi:hypothetical protein IRJ41_017086, partial [Triplophysa rosa]